MDNATFIATLSDDLRAEVLISTPQAILDTLPYHLQAEANILRERYLNQYHYAVESLPGHTKAMEKLKEAVNQEKIYKSRMQRKAAPSPPVVLESLLRLLYLEDRLFVGFPYSLLASLMIQPRNEFKVLDALLFILKNKDMPALKMAAGVAIRLSFPPTELSLKHSIVEDPVQVYLSVSLKALFVLSRVSQNYSYLNSQNQTEIAEEDQLPL